MPPLALLLILISALLHASWNLAAKRGGGTTRFVYQTAVAVALFWAPLNLYFAITNPSESCLSWSFSSWLVVALSAAVHAIYFGTLLHGYKVAPLSVVYPVARGTGPLLSSFAALVLFQETLTPGTFAGISLIVVGVVILSWQVGSVSLRDRSVERGIIWGALTGLFIAIYTVTDAYAIKTLKIHPIPYEYFVSVLRIGMLFPLRNVTPNSPPSREERRAVIIVSLLGPTAYILVLFAMQLAPLSHVAPARELSLMFGAFFGGKFLEEGHLLRRMTAAALIAVGVVTLSFS